MGNHTGVLELSPPAIAASYLLFGISWILVSDVVVRGLAETSTMVTQLQTIKGWVFVVLSTGLIFVLTYRRELQITAERDFTDLALDSLSDMFLVLTSTGIIQRVNDQAKTVLEYPESELVGSNATSHIVQEDRDSVKTAVRTAEECGESQVTASILTNEGARLQYEFRGRRMEDAEGNMRGIAVIGRDITDRLLNKQRLDITLRVLRHNLRNKLNVVQAAADELEGDGEPTVASEAIHTATEDLLKISNKARHMIELSEESKQASGERELEGLVSDVVDEFQEAHPDVRFETEIPATTDVVVSRSRQLDIALRNVFENAVEHNDSESPWVRVAVGTSSDETHITIQDNGPGIPEFEQDILETGSETPLKHSTGLGLWLVNWCMTMQGGSMEIEQRQPTGSEVVLNLPPTGDPST